MECHSIYQTFSTHDEITFYALQRCDFLNPCHACLKCKRRQEYADDVSIIYLNDYF